MLCVIPHTRVMARRERPSARRRRTSCTRSDDSVRSRVPARGPPAPLQYVIRSGGHPLAIHLADTETLRQLTGTSSPAPAVHASRAPARR
jgi:hypothetical protein